MNVLLVDFHKSLQGKRKHRCSVSSGAEVGLNIGDRAAADVFQKSYTSP